MRPCFRISNSLRLSALVVPLLMTSGCIVTDMKNTTEEMNNTTKEMAKTTAGMRTETGDKLDKTADKLDKTTVKLDDLRDGIGDTYSDLRQKEAVDMRNQMLDTLQKTTSLEAKVVTAGKYCMAFEFQLWKGNLGDTDAYRQRLDRDAMEEFFLDLKRYMTDPNESLDPTSRKSEMQNLMAIAGTIDRVNPNAQVLAEKMGKDTVSILSLIHEALKKDKDVERGLIHHSELLPYQQQVLIYKDEAIELLQARANFLPVMVLSRISDIQSRWLPMQAYMAFFGSKAKFGTIEALQQAHDWMQDATNEIKILRELGVEPQINFTLKEIYKNMELPRAGESEISMSLAKNERGARTQVEQELIEQIGNFNEAIGNPGPTKK